MFNRLLNHLEEAMIALLMGLATLIIFVAVLHRYTSNIGWIWQFTSHIRMSWAQELTIYLFIWMAKFGAAYGVRTGIHIGVDVLVRTLRPSYQRIFTILGLSMGAFFTGVIAILGVRFVFAIHATGQVSPDLGIPMWIIYLAIPLGSSLMCYRFIQVVASFIKTGYLPTHSYQETEPV